MFYFSNIFCWFTFHAIEGPDVNNALKKIGQLILKVYFWL